MRNIILNLVTLIILITQLDTGEYWLGIATIVVFINFIFQLKKDIDFKLF